MSEFDLSKVPPDQRTAVEAILKPTDALFKANRKTRRWARFAVGMAVVAVIAAAIAVIGIARASEARRKTATVAAQAKATALQLAAVVHQQNLARCLQGNDFRRGDAELWAKLLSFSPPPNETPAQAALRIERTAEVRAVIDRHDALIDCSKVP